MSGKKKNKDNNIVDLESYRLLNHFVEINSSGEARAELKAGAAREFQKFILPTLKNLNKSQELIDRLEDLYIQSILYSEIKTLQQVLNQWKSNP